MSAGDRLYEHQLSPRVMTDLVLIREESTAALQDLASRGIDWSLFTVILLKPDCLARELAESVLAMVSEHVTILTQQTVHPTAEQIFAHYDDILPRRPSSAWTYPQSYAGSTWVSRSSSRSGTGPTPPPGCVLSPREKEWWGYLETIEESIEQAATLDPTVLPALMFRVRSEAVRQSRP
jgi:hypothetical protein